MANVQNRRPHLFVVGKVEEAVFNRKGGGSGKLRTVDVAQHGQLLVAEVNEAFADTDQLRSKYDDEQLRATGSIIVIEGCDEIYKLKLEALDHPGRDEWRLLSVCIPAKGPERATVWVADRCRKKFLDIFNDYLENETKKGKPKNEGLVANIGHIRASLLRDLWQSDGAPPETGEHWWEIWLRGEIGAADLLFAFARANLLKVSSELMELDQNVICWIYASWNDLSMLPATAIPITEIRQRPADIDTLADVDEEKISELVNDFADRLDHSGSEAPAVCILDTGVRRTHSLLVGSLDLKDLNTITQDGNGDNKGHGTMVAGIALFGPISNLLLNSDLVRLSHRLESVKFIPDRPPGHEPSKYGLVTAQATSIPETTTKRRRVFCMSVTAPNEDSINPSLWSASIDALAMGTIIGEEGGRIKLLGLPSPKMSRLFVIAAGNSMVDPSIDYLDNCDNSRIHDPAQSWNALVVGAYTDLVETPSDLSFVGWLPMAVQGELSPHSSTGVMIPPKWPVRPDICLEGGNVLKKGQDVHPDHPLMSLETTGCKNDLSVDYINATSAATAQASRLAARAMAIYPDYWPETIKGLIVHGSEWTSPMSDRIRSAANVNQKRAVLGRYGWGVPNEVNVLTSSERSVTMVAQDSFIAFTGNDYKMRQFRLHHLPWPVEVLRDLGGATVRLKVTLAYFIEPSAARRGWRDRFSYASHGLKFDLIKPTETRDEFVRRVNRSASLEEDGSSRSSSSERWLIGPAIRDKGSLHQDIWEGTGAELSQCSFIAVFPNGGWWKRNKRKDRIDLPIRYALIVSLSTEVQGVDIYEPIAAELKIDVEGIAIEI